MVQRGAGYMYRTILGDLELEEAFWLMVSKCQQSSMDVCYVAL